MGKLVADIDPVGDLVITDHLRQLISIDHSKAPKIPLLEQGDTVVERNALTTDATSAFEAGSEVAYTEAFEAASAPETPIGEAELVREWDKARREYIYQRLLLFAAVTRRTESLGEFLQLVSADAQYRRIADNLGLMPEFVEALRLLHNNIIVTDRLERSMKAVIARAEDNRPQGFVQVVASLNVLSTNEVLTPIETAQRMIDALNLTFTQVEEMLSNEHPDMLDPGDKTGVILLTFFNRSTESRKLIRLTGRKISSFRDIDPSNGPGGTLIIRNRQVGTQ
jgi:hypothetical protein